jgi:hypothetical protein
VALARTVPADVVASAQILPTLMMEAICSSKMLVLTRATQHHIPQDGIFKGLYSLKNWLQNKDFGVWGCDTV